MKTKYIMILLFLSIIVLAGCTNTTEDNKTTSPIIKSDNPSIIENNKEITSINDNNIPITTPQDKEIYSCDFTKNSCDFEISKRMEAPQIGWLEGKTTDLDITPLGVKGKNIQLTRDFSEKFTKIEVLYSEIFIPVNAYTSIISISSWNINIVCKDSAICEINSILYPSNSNGLFEYKRSDKKQFNLKKEMKLYISVKGNIASVYFDNNKMFDFDLEIFENDDISFLFENDAFRIKKVTIYE